ncbi:MFS transporter [Micromonospora sp. KC213]|uniref:MFS transporter n=1 Tax=Micromonospora sp. KC213 TaxID=2530378 RepID=UPI00104FF66B|nr:MFS transporter [Micromonospora sp. KC213]TDC41629.1 MFS transporter [Micromonospora sp. KC213]
MPLFSRSGRSVLGRSVGTGIRTARLMFRGSVSGGRWVTRRAGSARARGAGGEAGMVRLFDLHALSCAGDTLIAIGLAGTIFFDVPLGEARSKVALYLLVTMVPFAMLAPVVGPLLDHFRHGRRYALATTMLGRGFLAWLISDYIGGFGLYPAAFGVLALSRAYGVARSAAVPRLLPEGLGLSQVGARASVYGTVAGALVAPIGLAAFWFGPQWPLRVASVVFLVGMVIALRLPPKADSEPPERVPNPLRVLRHDGHRPLGRGHPAGRLVMATLVGAAALRALYGFLLLFLAFALKKGDLTTDFFGRRLSDQMALGLVGGALAAGSFLATALGTRLRIHRPAAIQSSSMTIVAGVGILATVRFSLPMVVLLCLVTALGSGIAKLAVDASIQERIPERLRASSFAHSETALMLAFVAGGALGLVPFAGQAGVAVAAGFAVLAAVRGGIVAGRLRAERLIGRPLSDEELSVRTRTAEPDDAAGRAAEPDDASLTAAAQAAPTSPAPVGRPDDDGLAPPGYHIYRPSSAARSGGADDEQPRQSPGPVS